MEREKNKKLQETIDKSSVTVSKNNFASSFKSNDSMIRRADSNEE